MHCVYFPTNKTAMTTVSKPMSPERFASYLPLRTVRVREAVSALQAVQRAPSLAGLAQMARQSAECLRLVTPLIPVSMRSGVQAGPLQQTAQQTSLPDAQRDDHTTQWCLLAANSAVAAKLRQLAPALATHLRMHGHDVQNIRIKIAMRTSI
jgi:hypothetical protein